MAKEKTYIRYKILHLSKGGKVISAFGRQVWKKKKWYSRLQRPVRLCEYGFHCSENLCSASFFVGGTVLAQVEVKGKCEKTHWQSDVQKEVWQYMRILKWYKVSREEMDWGRNPIRRFKAKTAAMREHRKWADKLK